MNQFRPFLLIAWVACAALLYFQWVSPTPDAPVAAETTVASATGDVPSADSIPAAGTVPSAPATGPAPAAGTAAAPVAPIRVDTDVLHVEIDPRGGTLVDAELLAYPLDKDAPARKVRLLDTAPSQFSVAQSGLLAGDGPAPTHEAPYRVVGGRDAFAHGREVRRDLVTSAARLGHGRTRTIPARRPDSGPCRR